jgi:inhibitor of KinA
VERLPIWTQVSDSALLARFDGPTPEEVQSQVTVLFDAIRESNIQGIRNMHPAFRSLLVVYDPLVWEPQALAQRLTEAGRRAGSFPKRAKLVTMPVCFASRFAPDLPGIGATAGIAPDVAIELFTSQTYRVAFLGFAPGFPYLTGLPPSLATPRHSRPRTVIPAGSVGIAGEQTGIYPADTPGGWQIIGRTPLRLFDQRREPMSLLLPGDEVLFTVIDETGYEELSQW